VYDVAQETPLEVAPNLSARLNNPAQAGGYAVVFSFKLRVLTQNGEMLPDMLAQGVIAASAGNHAQGVPRCPSARNTSDYRYAGDHTPGQGGRG